jgi:hypothetical protein
VLGIEVRIELPIKLSQVSVFIIILLHTGLVCCLVHKYISRCSGFFLFLLVFPSQTEMSLVENNMRIVIY